MLCTVPAVSSLVPKTTATMLRQRWQGVKHGHLDWLLSAAPERTRGRRGRAHKEEVGGSCYSCHRYKCLSFCYLAKQCTPLPSLEKTAMDFIINGKRHHSPMSAEGMEEVLANPPKLQALVDSITGKPSRYAKANTQSALAGPSRLMSATGPDPAMLQALVESSTTEAGRNSKADAKSPVAGPSRLTSATFTTHPEGPDERNEQGIKISAKFPNEWT
ncbi:uncharacterized protein LOC144132434 [Amblyomma americanum]